MTTTVEPRRTKARNTTGPSCRSTRAALHDYLDRRLDPRHQSRFEAHMDRCPECIRAFIDIREASWMRRAVAGTAAQLHPRARRD